MKRIRVDNDVFCALKVHSNHVRNFLGENPFTLPAGPGFGGDLPPWREVGDACYGCSCFLSYRFYYLFFLDNACLIRLSAIKVFFVARTKISESNLNRFNRLF